MRSQRIEILHPKGHNLAAVLDLPADGVIKSCAIFAHCFTCGKDLRGARRISGQLNQAGIAVIRLDFTGLGESEGEFLDSGFTANIQDIEVAAEFLKEHHGAPSILIGHSLGGTAALHAAKRIDSIKAVVTIGSPADADHVEHLLNIPNEAWAADETAEVHIAGRPFKVNKEFLEQLKAHSSSEVIPNLGKALLVMHSPQDRIVEIDQAKNIYVLAKHPKSYISLDGADHLLSNVDDAHYVGDVISSWVKRYIDWPEGSTLETEKQVVARIGTEKYVTEIKGGQHSLVADEPKSVGGQDLGMSPYELLNASLGACTTMTLRMYADRKGWPLESVEVHLSHIKEHKADSENPDGPGSYISVFEKELVIDGPLDEQQRARLFEIAARCPVHRTLEGEVEIRSELRNGQMSK